MSTHPRHTPRTHRAARPLTVIAFAAVLAAAPVFASPSRADASECVSVRPGASLGPIRLGMTRSELDQTGIPVAPGTSDQQLRVGTFDVWMSDDAVVAVGADSAENPCVELGGASLPLPATALEVLAVTSAASCGPLALNTGATLIECREGLELLEHLGGKEVRVRAASAAPEQVCDARVQPGGNTAPLVARAEVRENARVCFETMVLTSDLGPTDVSSIYGKMHLSTCERTDALGAVTLDCNYSGVRLVFAGPEQRLARVESIALRK